MIRYCLFPPNLLRILHFKINKSCDNETETKNIYIIMYIFIVDSRKLRQSIAKKPDFIQHNCNRT